MNKAAMALLVAMLTQVPLLPASGDKEEVQRIITEFRRALEGPQKKQARQEAHKKIAQMGNSTIRGVLEIVYDEKLKLDLQMESLRLLGYLKTPEAKEALKSIMLDKKLPEKIRVASGNEWALRSHALSEVKDILEKGIAMRREGWAIRYSCLVASIKMEPSWGILQILGEAFQDGDETLGGEAGLERGSFVYYWLLSMSRLLGVTLEYPFPGAMFPEKCWKRLEALCKGDIPFPRGHASRSFLEYKGGKLYIVEGKSREGTDAEDVANILQNIRDKRSVELLEYLVKDTDPQVRVHVIQALANQEGDQPIQILKWVASHDADELNRTLAKDILKDRRGPREVWPSRWDKKEVHEAIKKLKSKKGVGKDGAR